MNQVPPLARYLMAVILLGLAGYMVLRPKGPNAWIGVRLPWTLADREIWDKSWLLAELMVMSMGLGALFFWPLFIISLIALIVLGLLVPPFLYYRKYGTWRFWKDLGWCDYRPAARCRRCGIIQKLENSEELAQAYCQACGAPLAP